MTTQWTSKSIPNEGGANPLVSGDIDKEFVVLLLYGKNSFGDKIYSYLKITIGDIQKLKDAVKSGSGFTPSDYGTVIAAGQGEPTQDVRDEVRGMYQVFDSQQKPPQSAAPIPSEKKAWDEY